MRIEYIICLVYCVLKGLLKGGVNMATYQPIASRMTLRIKVGEDDWGKPVLRSRSIAGVDVIAEPDDVAAVGQAIAGLLDCDGVVEVQKVDTNRVE